MGSVAEEWRSVEGYEGIYEVSSEGRVRSLDREIIYSDGRRYHRIGQVLSSPLGNHGYPIVCLRQSGSQTTIRVYRLVAMTFLEQKPGTEVNHINGDKTDSRVENLEWVTRRENIRHAVRTGLHRCGRRENHNRAKLTEIQIADIRRRYPSKGVSTVTLGKEFGVCHSTIARIVNGIYWPNKEGAA